MQNQNRLRHTINILKKTASVLKGMVLYFTLGVGGFVCFEFIHLNYFVQASDYVVYESVEPTKDQYFIGEKLQFVSRNETKKAAALSWNDILYCDDDGNGKYGYEVQYKSDKYSSVIHEMMSHEPWTYPQNLVPKMNTCCVLDSTTTVSLGLGVEHPLPTLVSEPFCFTGSNQ